MSVQNGRDSTVALNFAAVSVDTGDEPRVFVADVDVPNQGWFARAAVGSVRSGALVALDVRTLAIEFGKPGVGGGAPTSWRPVAFVVSPEGATVFQTVSGFVPAEGDHANAAVRGIVRVRCEVEALADGNAAPSGTLFLGSLGAFESVTGDEL